MVDNLDPYEVVKCKGCGKDVFPSERNIALKAIWHKQCLKCTTCNVVLTTKTLESFQMAPYCKAHLPKAKVGGGTQTAYTGATNVKDQPRAHNDAKTWDPQAEIQAAKASGYQAPEEKLSEHSSRVRRDPKAEVTAAKSTGYQAPEETRAEHDSQKRRDPKAEVLAAKSTGYQAPEETLSEHSSRVRRDPKAEVAAAKASGWTPPPEETHEYQREQIRGGAVSAVKSKFAAKAAPAEPAPPKPAAKPAAKKPAAFAAKPAPPPAAKPAPPPAGKPMGKGKPAPPPPPPEPEPEPEPEPQPEPVYEEQPQEQPYEEQPQEQPQEEQPPICGMSLWNWDKPSDREVVERGPFTLRVLESLPPRAYWELHPPLRVEICRMRGLTKTLEQAKAEAARAQQTEASESEAQKEEAGSGSNCVTM